MCMEELQSSPSIVCTPPPLPLYSVYSSTPSPLLYVLPAPLPPQPLLNISGFYTSAGYFWEVNNLNLVLHPS